MEGLSREAEANHSSFERIILHNKYVRYFMDPIMLFRIKIAFSHGEG